MSLNHIRHLPVVKEGKLVGLVSHRDLIRTLARQGRGGPPIWVKDVMTKGVETVSPQTPVRQIIDKMLERKYGCVPVVDAEKRLVGIITETDVLRLAKELLEREERGRKPG
jgi:CBS domain-containing protein